MPENDREKAIARILAACDPLPPWLSEAHYDDDYYELQAAHIALGVADATNVGEVRRIVDQAFEQTLPGLLAFGTTDDRLDERMDSIALAIWSPLIHADGR